MKIEQYKELRNEHDEQVALVSKIRLEMPDVLFYAVPNGGKRHIKTAVDLRSEGVNSGVPDLCFCEPRGKYHGLYIEMKRRPKTLKSGKKSFSGITTSDNQKEFIQKLKDRGYMAIVCYGEDEAMSMLKEYLLQ
jgi:hypothetical protein